MRNDVTSLNKEIEAACALIRARGGGVLALTEQGTLVVAPYVDGKLTPNQIVQIMGIYEQERAPVGDVADETLEQRISRLKEQSDSLGGCILAARNTIDTMQADLRTVNAKLKEAYIEADASLPKVQVTTCSYYGRGNTHKWVAVRATKSSVWARSVGSPNQNPTQFRKPKGNYNSSSWDSGKEGRGYSISTNDAIAAQTALGITP